MITFQEYMIKRDPQRGLTKTEAQCMGIPYPLEHGWMWKYADYLVDEDKMIVAKGKSDKYGKLLYKV